MNKKILFRFIEHKCKQFNDDNFHAICVINYILSCGIGGAMFVKANGTLTRMTINGAVNFPVMVSITVVAIVLMIAIPVIVALLIIAYDYFSKSINGIIAEYREFEAMELQKVIE